MSEEVQAVLDAALDLPEKEQIWLLEQLLESLPTPPGIFEVDDPELLEEVRRRAADNDPGIPWEQVKAEFLASLGQKNAT